MKQSANTARSFVVWWLGGLCFLPGGARASEPMRIPAFGEVVDVRVINLEVVVTRRGERLGGLGVDDFQLRVDGEEVAIEFFTEIAQGRAVTAVAASGAGALPALRPGEPVGTRYLVFIDDDFSIPTHRDRVLSELADQVALLEPEDHMAVVAFDGRKVDLLTSWTRSLARLEAAFDEARERRAYGLLRRSEQSRMAADYVLRPPRGTSFSGTGFFGLGRTLTDSGTPSELHYRDAYGSLSRVVRAATSALRGFARPPGRKVMLLLAGGWPSYRRWGSAGFGNRLEIERRLYEPLVGTANRLGYTLYPVDVQGGFGANLVSAQYGSGFESRARARLGREQDRLAEDALYHLAEETGGRALLGGARLTALERVAEDTRCYYWLGFTPTWEEDGQEHRVEIEMRPKGLKARSRQSFFDLSRQREVSMWIESAHLFDAPLPESADLDVELGEPTAAGLGKMLLPVRLRVPLDQVTTLPSGDGYVAGLELRVAATDGDGASADLPVAVVEIRGDRPPAAGQFGVYETTLRLRRKPHRLLISLYDPATGKVLSKRIELEL